MFNFLQQKEKLKITMLMLNNLAIVKDNQILYIPSSWNRQKALKLIKIHFKLSCLLEKEGLVKFGKYNKNAQNAFMQWNKWVR